MKPGQLVMLKPYPWTKYSDLSPPAGATGEVRSAPINSYLGVGYTVDFPRYPHPTAIEGWGVLAKYLIPLNDPDAALDVIRETELEHS